MHHHAPSIDSSTWDIFRLLSGHTPKEPRVVAIHRQTREVYRLIGNQDPEPLHIKTASVESLVHMVEFVDSRQVRVILLYLSYQEYKELQRLLEKPDSA